MAIVSLYAALMTVLFVALSIRTIRLRRQLHIPVGDGGNAALLRAMRAHANFAEYVPSGLLLMLFVSTIGAPSGWIHALGLALLIGRGLHGFGVSRVEEDYRFRVSGMALTFTSLLASSGYLLFRSIPALTG